MDRPAGWYPDPTGHPWLRWWDGGAWTAHIAWRRPALPDAQGALTLGLLGLAGLYIPVVGFLFALSGVVLGSLALRRHRDSNLAVLAISAGAAALALSVAGFIWSLMTGLDGVVTFPAPP